MCRVHSAPREDRADEERSRSSSIEGPLAERRKRCQYKQAKPRGQANERLHHGVYLKEPLAIHLGRNGCSSVCRERHARLLEVRARRIIGELAQMQKCADDLDTHRFQRAGSARDTFLPGGIACRRVSTLEAVRTQAHRFKSAVQFCTSVMGADTFCSTAVLTRKRWPSAVTS